MTFQSVEIKAEQIAAQEAIAARLRERFTAEGRTPLALVDTYGCQQNESDSERIRGYLTEMGFGFTRDEFAADIVVINTCAVREHAEMRVLGNVGALNHSKKAKPEQIICICGCMVQQPHRQSGLRAARALALSGAAGADAHAEKARLRRQPQRRDHRGGRAAAARGLAQGLAERHVRLQQLLLLLRRALCPRAGALAQAGGDHSRGKRACRGRI